MQTNNPFQSIVPKPICPSLINSPAVHLPPSSKPLLKPPHAISISTPNGSTTPTTRVLTLDVVDDSVAAFWDYQFLFVSQRSETTEPVTLRVVKGAVPPEFPSGTYYLTGPGLFSDDHGSTVHPLDGHGYLRAFSFEKINGDEAKVKFMAKYVKTEAQVEEHDPVTGTWRFTHRGPFSVLKGGQKVGNTKVMKNVANTSVVSWGGKLLCLWEGGDPYEIEPKTLHTVGKVKLMEGCDPAAESGADDGGVWDVAARLLKPILYEVFKMPPKRLLSHYKLDASRNRLLMMSCNAEDMLLPRSHFTFYEFDSSFKEVAKQEFTIPDHLMIHDWAFTDTHYILFANRIKLDIVGAMTAVCGTTPMITALAVNPSKDTSPIYLLPRFPDEVNSRDWRVPIEAPSQFWLLHVCNAYENLDENGNSEIQIRGSACSYEWFNFQKLFGYDWQSGKLDPSVMNINGSESLPHLVQVSIKLDAYGNCQRCDAEPLNEWNKSSDFPVINPAFSGTENKYIYAAASSGSRSALPSFPFDMVVKLNASTKSVHTWSVGSRRFIGEPTFIAKGSDEDEGYILVVEYAVAVQRCYLVILDSKKIGAADALVARLEVPKHLNFPLGFHGFWASDE
ncbi:carotenoid cleavage dioxygenase 7, chloroplastic [Argentina anserina]|uniref:carotenoid cleavage dioxygenase 7, chloroplastic n=1 Tax=Argentina anserina TaxID=57926 RepID=UPI0021764E7C|nr:carotenoid cleavage dioxygenase 7, chloroplastic [Potentilla anserina]